MLGIITVANDYCTIAYLCFETCLVISMSSGDMTLPKPEFTKGLQCKLLNLITNVTIVLVCLYGVLY